MTTETEINKIKVVLCALWNEDYHPDAYKIIQQYKEEIEEIQRGN